MISTLLRIIRRQVGKVRRFTRLENTFIAGVELKAMLRASILLGIGIQTSSTTSLALGVLTMLYLELWRASRYFSLPFRLTYVFFSR